MIALDTSAIVGVVLAEDDAETLASAIAARPCIVGANVLFEAHMVLRRRQGDDALALMRSLVIRGGVKIAPFDHALAELAAHAWDRYGKGCGHPAQLNFGDCMSYAVAKFHDVPLLYKGDDFAATDIRSALP
ncbi:MAG: hypothetical protein BGP06_01255 [Rhizobiales bacterium 65-9]|nr:MAG: hypothetical protein BGP06_01255 [Rhizobiales bacterium 65-9]